MKERTPGALIEEVAAIAVVAESTDEDALRAMVSLCQEISELLPREAEKAKQACASCLAIIEALLGGTSAKEEGQLQLERLTQQISAFQQLLHQDEHAIHDPAASASSPAESSTDPAAGVTPGSDATELDTGEIELPPWIDTIVLGEFLSTQISALEDLEALILSLEKGSEPLSELKRRVHTMKGEAGVMGFDELESVYHAIEDYLLLTVSVTTRIDQLLQVKDWIRLALEAYSLLKKPRPSAVEILALLQADAATDQDAAVESATLMTAPSESTAVPEEPPLVEVGSQAGLVEPVASELKDKKPTAPLTSTSSPSTDAASAAEKPAGTTGARQCSQEPVQEPHAVTPSDSPTPSLTVTHDASPASIGSQQPEAASATCPTVTAPAPAAIAAEDPSSAEKPASPVVQPAQPAEQADTSSRQHPVTRDEETITLLAEFLQEGSEGLNRADQILMGIEREGLTDEMVNGLFRVFHTIKGVAGFLELHDITALAHTTETMLNQVRQGTLELKGLTLDLIFDATELMRRMLEEIRIAVDNNLPFSLVPELPPLLECLQAVIEGRASMEVEIAAVEPGTKLGEILTQTAAIPPHQIAAALEAQNTSGRRLGEELVASGVVRPKQVAQALRVQSMAEAQGASKIKETIKVDLDRVDSLVEMIGELVIVESMVVNLPEVTAISSPLACNYLGQLTKITRDLQSVGMRMRMVPVRGAFQKMARMVRDLSRKNGKQVRLVQSGEGTEMDRSMVEQIADPLVHMIRNAVDHGLESAAERTAQGKPAMGVIKLSACHEGSNIVIEIADDGRGLDRDAILAKARSQGLTKSGQNLSDGEIYDLIFAPGFSTAKKVTEISGRGVGMDVVKRNIEVMRGRVLISSTPGKGTTFKILLPLTLAIIDGMLVACGEERYIIPTLSIVESIQPDRSMITSCMHKNELINVRGEIITLLRLDRLFNIPGAKSDPTDALVVVLESLGRKVGLLVDEVITQQQVVIKTLSAGVQNAKFMAGAAILSNGRVGLILNVEEIGRLISSHSFAQGPNWSAAPEREEPSPMTPTKKALVEARPEPPSTTGPEQVSSP